jgi:predicted kinase
LFVYFIYFLKYRNGKARAGVYCAANVATEQVVQHGEVDIFNAVKTVRRHRTALVENMVRENDSIHN